MGFSSVISGKLYFMWRLTFTVFILLLKELPNGENKAVFASEKHTRNDNKNNNSNTRQL